MNSVMMITPTHELIDSNCDDECQYKEEESEETNEVLKKWSALQRIIKEEITLEQIISKQLDANHETLLNSFFEYYSSRIKIREILENILNGKDSKVYYELNDDAQNILKDSHEPIKNLLFIFRKNFDYTMKFISIIEESDAFKSNNIDSIIELFCHQFYDNILIPDPEQEELQILCYLILKREIDRMNSASVLAFCDESYTFAGKFLKSFAKKQELKTYLSKTLGSLILDIEGRKEGCLDLNPKSIQDFIKDHERDIEEIHEPLDKYLTKEIPVCQITFNKDKKMNKMEYSNKYQKILNQDIINEMIQKEKDRDLTEFYLKQLERINKDAEIFTNIKFLKSLNDFTDNQKIIKQYKKNFLYIKAKIERTLQQLINKISTLPYIMRCICKMIHILISKKFPRINAYEKNSFLGEFIFGKWILPMLLNSNANAIILSVGLNPKTKKCLQIISKVITQINRGNLFESGIDTDFTIFNHFIIEVLPLIHLFYNKLINVQFPKVLNELVKKDANEPNLSSYKTAVLKRNFERQRKVKPKEYHETISYNYFDSNKEESLDMKCICFSLQDILTIIQLIDQNINEFETFPQFTLFKKTIDKIKNEDYKLSQEIKESARRISAMRKEKFKDLPEQKKKCHYREFFLVFKEEQNPKMKKKENERYMKLADNTDNTDIHKRIKFCIKKILKGINMINKKDYSYLNNARTTTDFLSALKNTLDDLEANIEAEDRNKIPLKWYSQYMHNNKIYLPEEYINDDYALLYNELFDDEYKTLEFLKEYISKIFTMNGMNIRCAEKINEKVKKDLLRVQQLERYFKIEFFVKNEKIEVCIQESKEEQNLRQTNTKIIAFLTKNNEDNDKVEETKIDIVGGTNCLHKKLNYFNNITENQNSKEWKKSHPKNINEFISIMKRFKQITEDIRSGKQKIKVYELFDKYFKIVKEQMNKPESIFAEDVEEEKLLILEKIEKYIMTKIYRKVFPSEPSEEDENFRKKTEELQEIKPKDLEIKKISVNELTYAIKCVKNMDSGNSVYDKLDYIAMAYNTINNILKFSSGKDCDGGAEDLSPIFQYIIIKAQPHFFYSNINYIRAFLSPSKYKGMYGYLLSQIEFSAEFIQNLGKEDIL